MKLTRVLVALALVVTILILWGINIKSKQDYRAPQEIVVDDSGYSFFIAGHAYGTPNVEQIGVYPVLGKELLILQDDPYLKYAFFTGDTVYTSTEAHWDGFETSTEPLGVDTYVALGNHDTNRNNLYNEQYGDNILSFENDNALFIVLDGNIDSWNIEGDQLEFLENTVKDLDDNIQHVFIFVHQLIWLKDESPFNNIFPNSDYNRADYLTYWDKVHPILSKLDQNLYIFNGDVGAVPSSNNIFCYTHSNVNFIASGMGNGNADNYLYVSVQGEDVEVIARDMTHYEEILLLSPEKEECEYIK